jgi:hypothetical protein
VGLLRQNADESDQPQRPQAANGKARVDPADFFGTSENAVKSQIWVAVSAYVLVALVKKRLQQQASLHTLLQTLSVTLFEKTPIQRAFFCIACQFDSIANVNQLNLFEF